MLKESDFVKIQVAVPSAHAQVVRAAMTEAGAGRQGNYAGCSGTVSTIGRFTPLEGAHPAIGVVGKEEEVTEDVIQMICHKDLAKAAVEAAVNAHPYEEPAIDIMPRLEVS